MGIYTNKYIPNVKRVSDGSEIGFEYISEDKRGRLVYTNNDDFIFYDNRNYPISLKDLVGISGNAVVKKEIKISSAELISGVTKTILPAPPDKSTYVIHKMAFFYNYVDTPYTGGDYILLKANIDGVSSNCSYYNYSNFIHASRSKTLVADATINNTIHSSIDSDTDYTISFDATTGGGGNVKINCYYTIEQTT